MAGEREPSEEALALLDEAPCGLVQTSDDGTFRRANRTFCQWVGHRAETLVGQRRFQDLLTVGARIFHQTHWSPLLQMQGSVSEVKLDIVVADGGTLPLVLNAFRRQEHGEMVHEIAAYVARDRDKYERELVMSRKRLEALVAETRLLHAEAQDRALFAEQMVGIVGHDLRNPLSGIVMATALLARGNLTPAQQGILARISRQSDRARQLIADLLDFTQARIGKGMSMSPHEIELHDVVAQTVDELILIYPDRRLEHVRRGEGRVTADPNRLAQLVGNLVSNAMTYGRPDTPVTVTSAVDAAFFSVTVHNDGAAIAAEDQARLFQPMTRGAQTVSSGRSVGLGLFIVDQIAKAHGGEASVQSTSADGTTFSVRLPRGNSLP